LAKTVHHLRIHAGNGIKIVVRERGRRLRYNQEMLLNRLGANAIADSTLSFSRFLSLLDSLRDRSYDREVAPVFEEAVLQAVPPEQQGYLPAREFVMAVREAVARSALLGVQCALLQLVINPQQAHLDVLKRIRIGRPGDLFTADDRCVYLFLFACREPDIDTALNRMVGMAQTELFDAQLRNADQDSINVALLALERHLRLSSPVDYSALLATPAAAPAPAPAAAAVPAPEPTIAVPREYQVLAMPAAPPRTAVREPLPVRT
ncbi:MAG TPA: BcsE family c-di-GMP-binding protein, partial [Nevskiaceae bacterium]|nr:BcsE family c-di-GMP-binding protein [Nevskiaceae bacterium]